MWGFHKAEQITPEGGNSAKRKEIAQFWAIPMEKMKMLKPFAWGAGKVERMIEKKKPTTIRKGHWTTKKSKKHSHEP